MLAAKTFVIADVHGMAALLGRILSFIESYAAKHGFEPRIVFVGDIVDRGADSRTALDLVQTALSKWSGSELLLGNHDDIFVEIVRREVHDQVSKNWVQDEGGSATLQSYAQVDSFSYTTGYIRSDYEHHLAMIEKASIHTQIGPFFACHAGVNRSVPLDEQSKEDLLWIRDEFLEFCDPEAVPVIHGHSIQGLLPVVTENRISIDTGAFATGRLTCMLVDEEVSDLRFFQTIGTDVVEVDPLIEDRGYGTVLDRLPELFRSQQFA